MIRYIDKDKNGCITTSEMDDILKEVYPDKLKGKCFKHIMRVFTAIQNPILLDYNKFRIFMQNQQREISEDPSKLKRFDTQSKVNEIESKLA